MIEVDSNIVWRGNITGLPFMVLKKHTWRKSLNCIFNKNIFVIVKNTQSNGDRPFIFRYHPFILIH